MIKFFKQNIILQLILVLLFSLVIWFGSFLHPQAPATAFEIAPLYTLCTDWMSSFPLLATILAWLLVLCEGVAFSIVLTRHKLFSTETLLPALIFLITMGLTSENHTLNPIIMALPFVILTIHKMMMYEKVSPNATNILDAALYSAIATMFCQQCIVMLLFVYIALTVHSLYHWRYWVMPVFGFAVPYIALAIIYYLSDRLYYNYYIFTTDLSDIHFSILACSAFDHIKSYLLLVATVVCAATAIMHNIEHSASYRHNTGILFALLFVFVLSQFYNQFFPINGAVLALPLSFWVTERLFSIKKRSWICDIIIIVLVILTLF
ncbi:MAG: hypothetical protein MJZ81_04710 [Bacteroidales bacterium]|nr:hypothetical protein [Bacteroidales bacterium]